jgi:CheY-like chemotaxis protein
MEITTRRAVRALIVDDDADSLRILSRLLEAIGCEVIGTRKGDAALGLAIDNPPDLVLLDLGMPKVDGFEVAKGLLQAKLPAFLLVALTGYCQGKIESRCLTEGFDYHERKPITLLRLQELIEEAQRLAQSPAPADACS